MDKEEGEIRQGSEGSSSRHTKGAFRCEPIPSRILRERGEVKCPHRELTDKYQEVTGMRRFPFWSKGMWENALHAPLTIASEGIEQDRGQVLLGVSFW